MCLNPNQPNLVQLLVTNLQLTNPYMCQSCNLIQTIKMLLVDKSRLIRMHGSEGNLSQKYKSIWTRDCHSALSSDGSADKALRSADQHLLQCQDFFVFLNFMQVANKSTLIYLFFKIIIINIFQVLKIKNCFNNKIFLGGISTSFSFGGNRCSNNKADIK